MKRKQGFFKRLRIAVQQGPNGQEEGSYSVPYFEPLSEARTQPTDLSHVFELWLGD